MFEEYIANEYLRALVLFVVIFVFLEIFLLIFRKVLPMLVSKTKTSVDDVILEKAKGPLTAIAFLVGIRFALAEVVFQETIEQALEGVWSALIIFAGALLIYYVLDSFISVGLKEADPKKKKRVNESLFHFLHSISKVTIFVVAFLMILSAWGVEVGPLLAGIGVAGIAIAFALQETLSNVFGGISVILDKSVRVGDVVKLSGDVAGTIMSINLRSTKIQTFDNELIIVPNSTFSTNNIQNIALPEPKARVVIPFGVAYGSDVDKVKKIVLKEVQKVEHYIDDPEPSVKFLEMGDSALNFKAFFYVDSYENRYAAIDEANTRIYNALNKAKISIPFPQMDVHLKKR